MAKDKSRLLYVDDDPYMQEYIAALMSDVAEVNHALTLAEARQYLQKSSYEVVLLDLTLPDGSGFDLIHDLSVNHPDTSIIIFSLHDVVTPPGNVVGAFEKNHFSEDSLVQTIREHCM